MRMQMSMKAIRVNKNMKQKEAADAIGVSVSTLKNWEAGKSFPTQPMIDKICEVYGVPYDFIKFF